MRPSIPPLPSSPVPADLHAYHGGDACRDDGRGGCADCGVVLAPACAECGGAAYHRAGCSLMPCSCPPGNTHAPTCEWGECDGCGWRASDPPTLRASGARLCQECAPDFEDPSCVHEWDDASGFCRLCGQDRDDASNDAVRDRLGAPRHTCTDCGATGLSLDELADCCPRDRA